MSTQSGPESVATDHMNLSFEYNVLAAWAWSWFHTLYAWHGLQMRFIAVVTYLVLFQVLKWQGSSAYSISF